MGFEYLVEINYAIDVLAASAFDARRRFGKLIISIVLF
jgi:hypothetical protein